MIGFWCTPYSGNREDCGPHQRLSKTTATACNYDLSGGELCTLCGFCVNRRKQSTRFEGNIYSLSLSTFHIHDLKTLLFPWHSKSVQARACLDTKPIEYETEEKKDECKNHAQSHWNSHWLCRSNYMTQQLQLTVENPVRTEDKQEKWKEHELEHKFLPLFRYGWLKQYNNLWIRSCTTHWVM